MKYIELYLFLFSITFISSLTNAQNNDYNINDKIISKLPKNVNIVGLGDPTHQESTITKFRVDLIKKLIEEQKFRIIAIEGNIYELYKGYQKFIQNNEISSIENAMYDQLNIPEMEELYRYVYDKNQKGDSVIIVGFDVKFSGNTFVENLEENLNSIDFLSKKEKEYFTNQLKKATITNLWALFRNDKKVKSKIVYYSKIILSSCIPKDEPEYFFEQALKNIVFLYDDNKTESPNNLRDMGMANNIAYLKELYKNEKIILFGSSTHLLKSPNEINSDFFQNNRKKLGELLTKKYHNDYYFIGYSAISGGRSYLFNNAKKLPQLNENSIEYKYQYFNSNIFLDKSNSDIKKTYSRFLGHSFLEINIWEVMDALVLIEKVKPAKIKKL
jgi:erythromycin esterase-like protein